MPRVGDETTRTNDDELPRPLHEAHGRHGALGIAVTVRCEGCIVCHVQDSLTKGATREEIQEVLGVAVLMGGGPSVVYACEALEALEELAPAAPVAALG